MRFLGVLLFFILLSGIAQAQSSVIGPDSIVKVIKKYEVWVGLKVDTAGKPYNIRIIKSDNPDLNDKAIKIVQDMKFEPSKTPAGHNVRVRIQLDEDKK